MIASKHLFAISLLISISIFSSVTKGAEQILATITTDVNSDSYQFILEVNEDEHLLKAFYLDNFIIGQSRSREVLPLDRFLDAGLILPQAGNQVYAKINGVNFDNTLGGIIVIDTLYNGITGKRRSYELELAQDQAGWKLFYKGKPITKIMAIAHKVPILGIVGAKELSMK